jgi:hypothetical protein
MANPILLDLATTVAEATSVEDSAAALIGGFAARLQAAVDAAIANGATADELKPVSDEVAALKASSDALATAVAANTPSA